MSMELVIEKSGEEPFTAVPNVLLRDPRLSFKAKGLYAYLYGCMHGWRISVKGLMALTTDGRDAILSAMTELENAGYITRHQIKENGRFVGGRVVVKVPHLNYEYPELPAPAFPAPGKPDTEKPDTENPQHNKTIPKNIKTNKTIGESGPAPMELFAAERGSLDHFVATFPGEWQAMAQASGATPMAIVAGQPPQLSQKRIAAATAKWHRSELFRARWWDALWSIPHLKDYCGGGRSGWRIDVDWFLKDDEMEKVLEKAAGRRVAQPEHARVVQAGGFRI